jgi:nucleoside-diphosphate-sugar epimerase
VLEKQGLEVVACDIKPHEEWFQLPKNSTPIIADLRDKSNCLSLTQNVDQVFNLACDMGGMGFIENNKAKCMESVLINTHLLLAACQLGVKKYFFSSSACVYASNHQGVASENPLEESFAYPADPEDGYGWEKLFSERFCRNVYEDYGIKTYVARYHNVYGPFGTFEGGREKVPAAACRKMQEFKSGKIDKIEIWGDGRQVRSFTYIEDCILGTLKLMDSDFHHPINIGSSEAVTIRELYDYVARAAGLNVEDVRYEYRLDAPQGVRGRSSDNKLCKEILRWDPSIPLEYGLKRTFDWIDLEMQRKG